MTLAEFVKAQGWPEHAIWSHLSRHGICSSNTSQLADIASPDHAECIAHLKALSPFHIAKIIGKR